MRITAIIRRKLPPKKNILKKATFAGRVSICPRAETRFFELDAIQLNNTKDRLAEIRWRSSDIISQTPSFIKSDGLGYPHAIRAHRDVATYSQGVGWF
jgi:hypothetical protein